MLSQSVPDLRSMENGNLMSEEQITSETLEMENGISVLDNNIRCRFTKTKCTGVLILTTIGAILALILMFQSNTVCVASNTVCVASISDNDFNNTIKSISNQTACVYVKQFHLQHQLYATVCNHDGNVFLDVKRFVNGAATINGVDLSFKQWLALKQQISHVDEAISEARTYWKYLRIYE